MKSKVDPSVCPLCGQSNACLNVQCGDLDNKCWCNNPNIRFEPAQLEQVPESHQGKACICQKCVQSFSVQ